MPLLHLGKCYLMALLFVWYFLNLIFFYSYLTSIGKWTGTEHPLFFWKWLCASRYRPLTRVLASLIRSAPSFGDASLAAVTLEWCSTTILPRPIHSTRPSIGPWFCPFWLLCFFIAFTSHVNLCHPNSIVCFGLLQPTLPLWSRLCTTRLSSKCLIIMQLRWNVQVVLNAAKGNIDCLRMLWCALYSRNDWFDGRVGEWKRHSFYSAHLPVCLSSSSLLLHEVLWFVKLPSGRHRFH